MKTKAPPDERYVSRSGILQPNVHEAQRNAEARMPQHQKDERLIDRTTLDDLENAILPVEQRITDRERSVALLTPEVHAAAERVEHYKEDVANCAIALAERIPGSRQDAQHVARKLVKAEESLAALKSRLDISIRVLAATKAISLEWHKVNGARLAKLRKLTIRRKIGDKF